MSRHSVIILLILGALALASRAVMIKSHPMSSYAQMKQTPGDEQFYMQLAGTLVHDHQFKEGFSRAYRPPLYPAFLAAHLALFGDHTFPIQLTQNLLFLATIIILTAIVLPLPWRDRAGESGKSSVDQTALLLPTLTAALLITNPVWLILPQQALSETLFIALFSLALYLLINLRPTSSILLPVSAGILFALAALTREIALYFALSYVPITWWTLRNPTQREDRPLPPSPRTPADNLPLPKHPSPSPGTPAEGGGEGLHLPSNPLTLRLSLLTLCLFLTILPWTLRNKIVLGKLIPITTNSTINLYMGNNPSATGRMNWALPPHTNWNTSRADELTAYKNCGTAAIKYTLANPIKTISLWPAKLYALWGPIPVIRSDSRFDTLYRTLRFIHWPPFLALALVGLYLMRREFLGQLLIATVLVATAIHLLTYGGPNYRAPYELLLSIPAAKSLAVLAQLFFRRSQPQPTLRTEIPALATSESPL